VARALEATLGEPESVNAVWKPQTLTPVEGDKAETLMKLIGIIEDDDDVQNVYANYDVDEAALRQLSAA
jgi:transcriptional/translational regulatory protein YebC/TACO1